jgi:cytochrome c biogenesis protein CcmG/thiol:disulfide interchange protein DsbE
VNWRNASIASVVGLPLIGLLAFGLTRDPAAIPSPLPGRAAPEFALTVFSPGSLGLNAVSDTVRLARMRGDVVVMNFWASWCLSCRDEHAVLSAIAERYRGKPVHFYGVLYNDQPSRGTEWIQQMGGQTYPSLIDPGTRVAIDYGLYGVPETFFIGRDGRVAYKYTGPVTADVLVQKVDSLLAAPSGAP